MPTSDLPQPTLIQRAQRGEAQAVSELYQLHAPAIFRYFYFRVQDRAAAEDLTSEVFIKMIEGLPRYEERGFPISAWLFRIAHDRVVDHHRRSAYRQAEPLSDTLEAREAGTEAQALARAEQDRLLLLLGTLTDEQQTVVQLRFIEGLSLEDCAQILGKTSGAIKSLQHRALRQLGQKLER